MLGQRGIQKSKLREIIFERNKRRAERESGRDSEPRHYEYISDLIHVCV